MVIINFEPSPDGSLRSTSHRTEEFITEGRPNDTAAEDLHEFRRRVTVLRRRVDRRITLTVHRVVNPDAGGGAWVCRVMTSQHVVHHYVSPRSAPSLIGESAFDPADNVSLA